MKRKVFSLMMLCLFAFLGLANAQANPQGGNLTVTPNPLEMGYRPNGAWMRPFEVQLNVLGAAETVTAIETTNEEFFLIDAKLPAEVTTTKPLKFTIDNPDAPAGPYSGELVVWTTNRLAYRFNIEATAYDPIEADVVETAPTINSSFSATFGADIYDNYLLPGDEADGKDVVYKLNVENDVLFSANVEGANGKVALYLPDFNGKPGPGADNSYGGNQGGSAPYEAQIGDLDGIGTTSYFPFYTYYNYSIAENLFHADELAEAGMNTAPMTSVSWYANNAPGYEQKNISVWMGNVADDVLTATSHNTSEMTLVYSGNVTPAIGWNEIVFNEGSFAWDGSSNLLICVQRNNGTYNSSISWKSHNPGFVAQSYKYQDGSPYNMAAQTYSMSTSSSSRATTLFKAEGRDNRAVAAVIDGMTLTPGEYYLVASSTSEEFNLNVNMETIPVPEPATNPFPANGDTEITMPLTFTWTLGEYTTEYRMLCGSNLPLTENNVLVDWTNNLAESLLVNDLYNNTNYFWRIDERNSSGVTIGTVWGFTTSFNVPQNLTAESEKLYPGETLHLSWDPIQDRSYRGYNVFQDDVQINTELVTTTNFDVTGLTYNMEGYKFNVNAHYDEGTSAMSNDLMVYMTGNGTVSGKVTELDGTTGIAGVVVSFEGVDEFNNPATYSFTTGSNGTYTGSMLAGSYTAMAVKEGYNPMEYEGNIAITYNTNTPNINFSLQEILYPVGEVIAEEVDENQVKVYWSMNVMSELIEDFETGDLSQFDWQNDATYPWSVVNGGHDSQYCMKSGNAGTASSTSAIQVSVEIGRDGLMSFWHKISSESSYDKGYFYIDGVEKMNTSGAGSWQQKEYAITAGTHTFKWAYTKDGSVNSNDDCWYVDDISFIHDAAPAESGWITYEDGTNEDAIGLNGGGSFFWGICFPASTTAQYNGFTLTKVKMYDYAAHTGKVMIYKGGETAPGTLATEQNYTCTGSENYVEVALTNPVTVDPGQSLWVVMNNFDGQYIAACCANTGDPNGRWISLDGIEWMDILEASASLNYTWQIHAYLTDGSKTVTLDRKDVASNAPVASPSIVSYASVNDLQGDPNWKASTRNNRAFSHFNIYRTVCSDVTGESAEFLGSLNDTLYFDNDWATLEPGVYKWGVSRFYEGNRNRNRVTYDFESGLDGWTSIDNDGDGNNWAHSSGDGIVAHSGMGVAASESYINYVGALTPDNWLVSPQVALGGTMTFWAAGQDPSYASEHFAVYVSTSGTAVSNFTQVMNETVATGTMTQYTVDLSSYSGNGYVAIRHYNCTDMFRLNVDDITLGEGGDDPNPPTPPTPPTPTGGGEMTYTGVYGESGVLWSNCLEHNMYVTTTVTVNTNSGEDVTGATVTMYNTSEPDLDLTYTATLDETGVYTWETMRRGTYEININLSGFDPIAEEVEIGNVNDLHYTLNETIEAVSGLYVSATGWAMFGEIPAPTPVDPVDPVDPSGSATVTLAADDVWGDGSGYQMLLDADATAFGTIIPTSGPLSSSGNVSDAIYAEFEYKIPENADGNLNTQNIVINSSVTITIPAGTYDWCITNPTPGDRMWIASSGGSIGGRYDDFNFEAGKTYTFHVYFGGTNDATDLTVTDGKSVVANTYAPMPNTEAKNIANVTKIDGANGRMVEYYKVMLDGELEGTTTHEFFQHNVEGFVEGETHTTSVQKVYTTGESEWISFDWVYTPCDNFEGLQAAAAQWVGDNVVLDWTLPAGSDTPVDPVDPVDPTGDNSFSFDFEGSLNGWNTIDADGNGLTWYHSSNSATQSGYDYTGLGHNGSNGFAVSQSYIDGAGAYNADNYLYTPQMYDITNGSVLSFWADYGNDSYPDLFGVYVSTAANPTASDFTMVWQGTAKSSPAKVTSFEKAALRHGNSRYENWRQHNVDLSAYAGQTVWIAFRHVDYDNYEIWIDDVTLTPGSKNNRVARTTYDFEDGLQGWTSIDNDGDGNNWMHSTGDGIVAHSGMGVAASESYINYVGALTPDNWLVSPQVALGGTMTFWAAGQDPSYAAEHFAVYVSTSGTAVSNFTQVLGEQVATGTMTQYTVDLSSYSGNGYVAIRHYNVTDMFRLNVDDITLGDGTNPDPDPDPDPTTSMAWDFEADFAAQELLYWTTINANNDEYTWYIRPTALESLGHNNSQGFVTSASYMSAPITPDDYLVSPQLTLGGTFSFWACAQDASYPAEHFGVAVSTTGNTNAADFTMVDEWTMTAKGTGGYTNDTRSGNRVLGNWYQYTVDLSSYSGQGYIAIRHFNCNDMFRINVDDIEYTVSGDDPTPTPASNVRGVEIFRDGEWIAEVLAPEHTYTDIAPGELEQYEIRVVYNGNTEDYTHYTMSCPEIVVPTEVSCTAPTDLTGSYEYFNANNFGAFINWSYSEEVNVECLQYDDNNYAISVGAGGPFSWAVMFPAGTYNGSMVTKVSTYDYLSNATIMNGSVSIWTGGSNAPQTQLATKAITFTGSMEEVEFTFDEPVIVDPSQNLWVVFVNDDCAGYPAAASTDSGDPNGRWVGIDGGWYDLAAAGLPGYGWIIHCYVSDPILFNVYRNNEVIATVPYSGEDMSYYDQVGIGNYTYQVTTAVGDCESDFALTPDESQNYIEINVTDVNDLAGDTKLYPNPTNGNVKIEAAGMTHITVMNALGQVLSDTDINGDMYELSLGQYKAGIYLVRIATENGISVKRVTLVK